MVTVAEGMAFPPLRISTLSSRRERLVLAPVTATWAFRIWRLRLSSWRALVQLSPRAGEFVCTAIAGEQNVPNDGIDAAERL